MRRTTCAKVGALVLLPLAAVVMTGCGDDGTTVPPDVRGTIEVANQTADLHVFMLFFRECGTTNWGLDRLPDDPCTSIGCIAPAQSRSFTVEAGCYDLKADLADLDVQEVVASDSTMDFVVLAGGSTTWNVNTSVEPPGPQ